MKLKIEKRDIWEDLERGEGMGKNVTVILRVKK